MTTAFSFAYQRDIASYFSQPNGDSANRLAALINQELGSEDFKQNTTALDHLLSSIASQLALSSLAHRETIDDYVTFVSFAALQINSAATHPGTIVKEGDEQLYRIAPLHPASGPDILGEHLSKALFDSIWKATSRAVTPDEENDREHSKEYYYKASVQATILARAFALAESMRGPLWRDVEDILIKGLFSGDEQEPGVFVALAAIFLGAGKEIKDYMGEEKKGKGRDWLWYDDIKTKPDVAWGWKDVVEALKSQPGPAMVDRLPEYVKGSFELAKKHVAGGSEEDWESERLAAEAFNWASTASA